MILLSRPAGPSSDGQGPCFRRRLPAAKRASLAQRLVISVVDDDASVRASINNFLRSLGYVVHTFWSAEKFLGSPQLNDTSCVIADIQMSAMDGLELLANIRMPGSATPFIFITAFPDESARARTVSRSGLQTYGEVIDARCGETR